METMLNVVGDIERAFEAERRLSQFKGSQDYMKRVALEMAKLVREKWLPPDEHPPAAREIYAKWFGTALSVQGSSSVADIMFGAYDDSRELKAILSAYKAGHANGRLEAEKEAY